MWLTKPSSTLAGFFLFGRVIIGFVTWRVGFEKLSQATCFYFGGFIKKLPSGGDH